LWALSPPTQQEHSSNSMTKVVYKSKIIWFGWKANHIK
jgi:hypothetical protein